MKPPKLLKIPDEIIEQIYGSSCIHCGDPSMEMFGVFYPLCPDEWDGYSIIFYPLCSECLHDSDKEKIEDLLFGLLLMAKKYAVKPPFSGVKAQETDTKNKVSSFENNSFSTDTGGLLN